LGVHAKHIREFENMSKFLCKPEVRDGFGYLDPFKRIGLRTLKGRVTDHSDLSFISFRTDTLKSLINP
jgi:hypothetical protein